MSVYSNAKEVPFSYDHFNENLEVLDLPIDVCQLHGILSGCLVAGAPAQAENYLRSLILNRSGPEVREATNTLFSLITITQAWLTNFGFEFHLLLPEDTSLLPERLESFACWCQGFMKGLDMADLSVDDIDNEDILEAIGHIDDFSDMDASDFDYEEDDEKAYFEITEYVRLSVLHIFCDLNETEGGRPEPVHH